MSLYSDPKYFHEHRLDLSAPEETPVEVTDLDGAFKNVLNNENYNQLEHLRMQPNPQSQVEMEMYALNQKTSSEMKFNANQLAQMITSFGYPAEAG